MSVIVKICGITCVEDALAAAQAGAHAIGLMFYEKSPRHVSLATAAAISHALPPEIVRVGVFVNAEEATVRRALAECTLNVLQFHGEETPEYCRGFEAMTVKALRVRDAASLDALEAYSTDAFLLDAYTPDAHGGTGARFDWDLAVAAKERFRKPLFLAGGLTAENVAEAVRRVQPFGVDVSSGVESAPGKKDAAKIRAFVAAAKSV